MTAEPSTDAPGLVVRIPPTWDQIEPLRHYVGVWTMARGGRENADRAGIVAQELLENAVKYGDPKSDIELTISVSRAGQCIDVCVKNKAHPSRLAVLEREILRSRASDPRAAFARALERLNRLPEGSSMLGLARVALEAVLDVHIGADFVVTTARVVSGVQPSNRAPHRVSSSSKILRPDVAASHTSGTMRLDPTMAPPSHTRLAGGVLASHTVRLDGDGDLANQNIRAPSGRK